MTSMATCTFAAKEDGFEMVEENVLFIAEVIFLISLLTFCAPTNGYFYPIGKLGVIQICS